MKKEILIFQTILITWAILSVAECTDEKKICGCGCGRVLSSEEVNNSAIIAGRCMCKACTLDAQKNERVKRHILRPHVDVQESLEFSKKPLKKVKDRQILDDIDNIKMTGNHNLHMKHDKLKDYHIVHEKNVPNVMPKYPGSRKMENSNTYEDMQPLDFSRIYRFGNIFQFNASCDSRATPNCVGIGLHNINTSFGMDLSNNLMHHIFNKQLDDDDFGSFLNSNWHKLKITNIDHDSSFDISLPEISRLLGHDCGKALRGNRNEDERHSGDVHRQRIRVQPLRIKARIPIDFDTLKTFRHLN